MKKTVVIGLLGSTLDQGKWTGRWNTWRPSVSICQHEELLVDRFHLLYQSRYASLAGRVGKDIKHISPETELKAEVLDFKNPWDFEEVYEGLYSYAKKFPFDTEKEDYLIHITTGTHVAQICLFLLNESGIMPGKLLQTSPPNRQGHGIVGTYTFIDLDLARYDRIAARFQEERKSDISFLKSGIETRNPAFNRLIEMIEKVALRSPEALLLTGPTGAGKSHLARKIYELKKMHGKIKGSFVELNCATLRGDSAMSALFGHKKGAFTGAAQDRNGLLLSASEGILFLDEIGELGLDEQAMLLRAIEEKRFLPLGSDKEVSVQFQLICGTNKELKNEVEKGRFREDLLARINLWTFRLPGLKDRKEDIEPNLEYELKRFAEKYGSELTFNKEAKKAFLEFAVSKEAVWTGNFRELNAAVTRICTLSSGGRISIEVVEDEIQRLKKSWQTQDGESAKELALSFMSHEEYERTDLFERVQLNGVLKICMESKNLSDAGRKLFSASRTEKSKANDADRLRKYLARFNISWNMIQKNMS